MTDSHGQHPVSPSQIDAEDRLDSWKEIAVYLDRDVSTVRRWEKKEGLPVHRHMHDKLGTVYASRTEIDAWLAKAHPGFKEDESPDWLSSLRERKLTIAGIAAGALLVLVAGLVWTLRSHWVPPGVEALHFQERDFVLISFENRTGEAALDEVLEYALGREIANSQFVNVVPGERIQDTLRLKLSRERLEAR